MSERPILFSSPMIRALLAGRKTQTRRLVKPQQPKSSTMDPYEFELTERDGAITAYTMRQLVESRHNKYGVAGDRLWVREAFLPPNCVGCDVGLPELGGCICNSRAHVEYRATSDRADGKDWTSPLFMPRWASRITLEVTGVRVERVQDISEADAHAEGVKAETTGEDCWTAPCDQPYRRAFEYAWNEIHGWNPNAWNANPFVWVISFRRVEAAR